MKSANRMGEVMVDKVPLFYVDFCSKKSFLKVMWPTVCQMVRSVYDRSQKQWIPWRLMELVFRNIFRMKWKFYKLFICFIQQLVWIERIGKIIHIIYVEAGCFQTIVNGMKRQFIRGKWYGSLAMFDVSKPFLFSSVNQLTILHQASRRIMKACIYS